MENTAHNELNGIEHICIKNLIKECNAEFKCKCYRCTGKKIGRPKNISPEFIKIVENASRKE